MAAYGWQQTRSVEEALFEEGHLFSFHQALRLLEAKYHQRKPCGEEVHPENEVVRFSSSVRFDFPASEVEEIRPSVHGKPAEMTVNVMGLAGEFGPLPAWVGERAMERSARGDRALAEFLDLFNHRLLSLLYRARKKYRPALASTAPDKSRIASCLYALLGLGTDSLREALGISVRALLPFAGLLAARPRSMVGLERLLSAYFNVPVEVVPFRGKWQQLEEADVTYIGHSGQNQILGESAVLGRRVWDPEASFEVRIGPLTHKQFIDFLPLHTCHRVITVMTRFYVGEELGYSFRLVHKKADVPELRLGRKRGGLLGWTTWLKSEGKPFAKDDEQVRLRGRA